MPFGDKKKIVTIILGENGMRPSSLQSGSEAEIAGEGNMTDMDYAITHLAQQMIASIEAKSVPSLKQCLKTWNLLKI